jgi:hypothetical protein
MRNFILLLVLLASVAWANPNNLQIQAEQTRDTDIVIRVQFDLENDDQVWDTYVYYVDSRQTPIYVTMDGNYLQPKPLGMLSPQIRLRPENWRQNENVEIVVALTKPNSTEVIGQSKTTATIAGQTQIEKSALPTSGKLVLVQEVEKQTTRSVRSYTDYKQFDSRWKYNRMGQSNGTSIGKSGCAMSAAGNVVGMRPDTLNRTLQSNGGYSGNLLIWSKVPGTRYHGSGSISSGLFGSYHVIANVGGHFVLLTGYAGSGRFYSHDPGKSSNPVYRTSQIYSVRLYRR